MVAEADFRRESSPALGPLGPMTGVLRLLRMYYETRAYCQGQ
jgi:hypothetical protein